MCDRPGVANDIFVATTYLYTRERSVVIVLEYLYIYEFMKNKRLTKTQRRWSNNNKYIYIYIVNWALCKRRQWININEGVPNEWKLMRDEQRPEMTS